MGGPRVKAPYLPQEPPKAAGIGNPTTPAEKVAQSANMRCADCANFRPDTINPPQGVGRCTVTLTGLPPKGGTGYGACYPFSPRRCTHFQSLEDNA